MPGSSNVVPVFRTLAFRPRATFVRPANAVIGVKRTAHRTFADKSTDLPKAEPGQAGPNMNQAEHVSEEAAKMAQIQGGSGPDIEGQGTPVQDILREEKDTLKTAPQVMKDQAKNTSTSSKPNTRAFSTMARRRMPEAEGASFGALDPSMLPNAADRSRFAAEFSSSSVGEDASVDLTASEEGSNAVLGHKFPLPASPLPRKMIMKTRYDPVVEQVTNLIMRHGKKSVAQRNMATILNILRTSSPPKYSETRPVLPGAPPALHLPLNPILYLTLAIDSVAPLVRIRVQKGAAGGGQALQIPVPLALRQRRRTAFMWILDAVSKKKSRSSGKDMFATRLAEELIAVVEGRSAVWERRNMVHKLGTTARSALSYGSKSGGFRR